jgi:hypothetical protein
MNNNTSKKVAVTIVTKGMFGIRVTEAWLLDHGTRKWAQYDNAPFVEFVVKGKRKPQTYLEGYNPYLVILAGHDLDLQKAVDDQFVSSPGATAGVTVTCSRYLSCDPRYSTDFNAVLAARSDLTVVADYRQEKRLAA